MAAAYALRFVGEMRFRRQLGNDIALDRLRSVAAGCTPADAALVHSEPVKRAPSVRKKRTKGQAKRDYLRSLERDVGGGAPGLGRHR